MKIAIIGGGSAGLVTAHLLDGAHDVTIFEKAPILGGHVRTLNRNVVALQDRGLDGITLSKDQAGDNHGHANDQNH